MIWACQSCLYSGTTFISVKVLQRHFIWIEFKRRVWWEWRQWLLDYHFGLTGICEDECHLSSVREHLSSAHHKFQQLTSENMRAKKWKLSFEKIQCVIFLITYTPALACDYGGTDKIITWKIRQSDKLLKLYLLEFTVVTMGII